MKYLKKAGFDSSFKELADKIEEHNYILEDEGYNVEILQFKSSEMNIFIWPKSKSEIENLKRKSSISLGLYNLSKGHYFKKFPWTKNHDF